MAVRIAGLSDKERPLRIGVSTNGAEIAVCFAVPNVRKHRPYVILQSTILFN